MIDVRVGENTPQWTSRRIEGGSVSDATSIDGTHAPFVQLDHTNADHTRDLAEDRLRLTRNNEDAGQ